MNNSFSSLKLSGNKLSKLFSIKTTRWHFEVQLHDCRYFTQQWLWSFLDPCQTPHWLITNSRDCNVTTHQSTPAIILILTMEDTNLYKWLLYTLIVLLERFNIIKKLLNFQIVKIFLKIFCLNSQVCCKCHVSAKY